METRKRERRKRSGIFKVLGAIKETAIILVVALVISTVIKTFLLQAFLIPSVSMEDTLRVGDRVFVSKLVPKVRDLHRGDIVVFYDSQKWLSENNSNVTFFSKAMAFVGLGPDPADQYLIKRVIGVPGDRIVASGGNAKLKVNGVEVNEPYLKPGANPSATAFDVKVPKGKIWVMGDNRDRSADSRAHMNSSHKGFVDISDVQGRAFTVIWPWSNARLLNNDLPIAQIPLANSKRG